MVWFSLILLFCCGCHPRGGHDIKSSAKTHQNQSMIDDYQWRKPIVQEIVVPAQIRQGFYEPEHREIVVIKPGYWEKVEQGRNVKQEELSNEDIANIDHGVDISAMPNPR